MVKKNDDLQDEYQYSEEEFNEQVIPEPEPKPAKPGMFSVFKSKGVLIPIIMIVAIIAVAQFLSRSEPQVNVAEQPKEQKEQKEPKIPSFEQQSQPVKPVIPVATAPAPVSTPAEVQSIRNQLDAQTLQLKQLGDELAQLKAALDQMQTVIVGFNAMIETINRKLESGEAPARIIKPVRIRETIKVIRPWAFYRLKAIMPGRAWLESSRGTTLTVKVGDKLPGQGTVVRINVPEGAVVTSDGTVITYGRNDS
jgi:intracellular multiplication protein IcmG